MKTQVQKHTPEWNSVHYRIQLVLGFPAVLPIKVYKFIDSAQELREMKQMYPNKTILNGHINQSELDEGTQRKILQKKPIISTLLIQTGHLKIKLDTDQSKKMSLWLLKAAVGDSYSVEVKNKRETFSTIPEQYDSVYLYESGNQDVFEHNFILKDPSQYVLQYEVLYVAEKTREFNPRQFTCNKCLKRIASIYCKHQEAFFCNECNILHHKERLLSSHVREQLNKFNTIGICKQPNHGKLLEIYCEECKTLLCVQCNLNGWHSTKQYESHQVKALKKWYQQKYRENQDFPKSKVSKLEQTLNRLDKIMNNVDEHALSLQRKIRHIYDTLLTNLKNDTKDKLDKLLVVKTEVKRQYDELLWANSFIKYQHQLLKPIWYLDAQKQYELLRDKLLKTEIRDVPKINIDDIQIAGDLRLIDTNNYHNNQSFHTEQKGSKEKHPLNESRKSIHSKYSGQKISLNNMLDTPQQNVASAFKSRHFDTYQDKSVSRVSEQSKTVFSNVKPKLEQNLQNANLSSIRFT